MAEKKPQTFANHGRVDPLYHFFMLPVFFLSVIGTIVVFIRQPGWYTAWIFVVSVAAAVMTAKVRTYALKVQDRVILLEERLRLAMVLPEAMRPRIPELSEGQLIALRFAPVAELPLIVESALKEKLPRKEIKKLVQSWQPDYWRV
jgi:hypothetical protein